MHNIIKTWKHIANQLGARQLYGCPEKFKLSISLQLERHKTTKLFEGHQKQPPKVVNHIIGVNDTTLTTSSLGTILHVITVSYQQDTFKRLYKLWW